MHMCQHCGWAAHNIPFMFVCSDGKYGITVQTLPKNLSVLKLTFEWWLCCEVNLDVPSRFPPMSLLNTADP
jgi:hypothetical protein